VDAGDETKLDTMREATRASSDAETAAKKRHADAMAHRDQMSLTLEKARDALAAARSKTAEFARRRAAELELARLQGALEERIRTRIAVQGTLTGEPDSQTITVVRAAVQEAETRIKAAAADIFSALNDEVCRLAQGFGMSAVSAVKLDRAGRLKVTKGGQPTWFSHLTPGERLRLRVATVAALLKIASQRGVGRHPGLLLLDSPGSEEMRGNDAAEFVRELAEVASGIAGFQILVTTARPDVVANALTKDRIRLIAPGQYVW
jgi:hypothetical protein